MFVVEKDFSTTTYHIHILWSLKTSICYDLYHLRSSNLIKYYNECAAKSGGHLRREAENLICPWNLGAKKASTSQQIIHGKGGEKRMHCCVVHFHFLDPTSIMQIPSQSDDLEVWIEFTHTHKSRVQICQGAGCE